MVPFVLELELENKPLIIMVEQLERFADVDGYTRYDVTGGERRSVIYVNVTDESPVNPACNEEEIFTAEECTVIAGAIRQYNRETKVVFAQFLLDF
jgi:hypothetical protein